MEEITNKKIASSISWSFAEKLLTDIVSTFVTLFLARLLLPKDYGVVALVQIFINISLIFVNTGLSSALIQNKDADEQQVSTIFYINLLFGIVIYIILFFAAPLIAEYRKNDLLRPLFRVLAIKIPVSSIYSMQHAYVKKKLDFKKYFFSSLAGTIASGVVGIYMAYKGYGAWALVASTLVDQIMDSIILFFTTRWFPKLDISISKSKKTISFGFKILLREFVSRTYNQLRNLLIGLRYQSEDLAFSGKGQKLPELVSELTESTMVRVMLPVFSSIQDDKEKMFNMVSNTIRISIFIIAPFMVGLAVTSDRFIPLILTSNWIPCIPYLKICCANNLFGQITHADLRAIEASGKGNTLLKIQIINTIVGLITIAIAIFAFDSPIYIIAGALVSTIISGIVIIYYSRTITDYGFMEHINDIKHPLIISLLMGIIVFFIGKLPFNDLVILMIQVISGIIIYVSLSILTKNREMLFIIKYIKNKKKE